MKTHFDPYVEESCFTEYATCGIVTSDKGYNTTTNWDEVTCKRCIRQKENIIKFIKETEDAIVKQMDDFVEFQEKQDRAAKTSEAVVNSI